MFVTRLELQVLCGVGREIALRVCPTVAIKRADLILPCGTMMWCNQQISRDRGAIYK